MKAQDLKPGQQFRLKGQSKYRTVASVYELTEHDHIPPAGRKILIIHDGCKQLVVMKDTHVTVKQEEEQ